MGRRKIDLTGQKFGRLTVLEEYGRAKYGHFLWLCVCEDGNKCVVRGAHLNSGHSASCGCLQVERITKHGHNTLNGQTPEYKAWQNARERCTNPNKDSYSYYGGRGIEFLFTAFEEFLAEVGLRPSDQHSIDRIDVDGHYAPGNVRWATAKQQANNKRRNKRVKASA
jgi:hypothetical protein